MLLTIFFKKVMYCTMLVEVGIEEVQGDRGPRAGVTEEEDMHPRHASDSFQGLCYISHTIRLPSVPAKTQPTTSSHLSM